MLTRTESPQALKVIASPNYDQPAGKRSQLIVVHSAETPLTQGYAVSISKWLATRAAGVAPHYFAGPAYAVQQVAEHARAWHCGKYGNICTIGIEQTGYARFSRREWTTKTGLAQIAVLSDLIADISQRHSGGSRPQRATNAQIKAYARGGTLPGGAMWCTHHQITQALGGTTHTDPDPNYPYDLLQAAINSNGRPARPGQSIKYVVKQGDTLSAIAEHYGTTVPALARRNKISNPDRISIGQTIELHTTTPPKPKPPATLTRTYTPPPHPYPWRSPDHYGIITGNLHSHGGYNRSERTACKWLQLRMLELGYAKTRTGRRTSSRAWADGRLEQLTINAFIEWQKEHYPYPKTTLPGQIWADDWARLADRHTLGRGDKK